MNKLSDRLETIIGMVPETKGGVVADVGTDHGFVPIRLVLDGKAGHALAMDVRPGPLARARGHIRACGLEAEIETRLGDGLEGLNPGEAEGVVIAGMGGDLMLRILQRGGHVRGSIRWWVLSPQSELGAFRHGLEALGIKICEERMVAEDGKFYTVMLARPGAMHYDREYQYRYGARLIEEKSPVLKAFLEKEQKQLRAVLGHLKIQGRGGALVRRNEILDELKELEEAYDAMQ